MKNVFQKRSVLHLQRVLLVHRLQRSLVSATVSASSFGIRHLSSIKVDAVTPAADSVLLDMLLNHSHWKRVVGGDISIQKSFELRDVRTADRFENMVKDFLLRLETRQRKEEKNGRRIISLQIDKKQGGTPIIDVSVIRKSNHGEEVTDKSDNKRGGLNKEEGGGGKKKEMEDFVVSQKEVDIAMAVDMIAAELQLGGNPNWS